MARVTQELSATAIDKAKPESKDKRLYDGKGLFLLITPKGGKWWRFKYSFSGKENTISFGTYPEISLKDARQRRDDARKLLANDIDPSTHRKQVKDDKEALKDNSFELIARDWHKKQVEDKAWTDDHAVTIMTRMEKDMFPWIGATVITEVTAKEIKTILDRVKSRGFIETARRCYTIMGQVYRHAIMIGKAQYDISAGFRGYLPAISKTRKHMASVTDPKELAPLLRAIDGYQGGFVTQCALKLLPLLFVRPGELRHMEWSEIDLESAEWNIQSCFQMNNDNKSPRPKKSGAYGSNNSFSRDNAARVFVSSRSQLLPACRRSISA
jgi:hypothetical protein